jgi:hypothetical protein
MAPDQPFARRRKLLPVPRRKAEAVAAVAVAVAVLWTAGARPTETAGAVSPCNGNGFHTLVGAIIQPIAPAYLYRVQADIRTRNPGLCGTGGDSSAWTMLTNENGYAQIGWLRNLNLSSPTRRYFWEWRKSNSSTRYYYQWGNPDIDTYHNYRVSRYDSDNHLHMILDGSSAPCNGNNVCPHTDFDPFVAWNRMEAQVMGETADLNDDIPGDTSDPNYFDNIQETTTNDPDGTWWSHNFAFFGELSDECYYHHQRDSSTPNQRFWIWTAPTNHNC